MNKKIVVSNQKVQNTVDWTHENHRLPTPTNPELATPNESISLKYGKTIRDGKLAISTCPLENAVIDLLESPTYPPASKISRFFQSLRQNCFLE
jgi:hypothetical protein